MSSFQDPLNDTMEFAQNFTRVAEKSQEILRQFLSAQSMNAPSGSFDPFHVGGAFMEMFSHLMAHPGRVVNAQMELWQNYMLLWQTTALKMLGQETQPVIKPDDKDRRFKDASWEESVVFDFIKQSYLLTARWLQEQAKGVEGLDEKDMMKVDFYTRQFVDAMAPSNFVMTNPEVLRATIDSKGENLVHGLQHMLEDLERGKGKLDIKMTDLNAFKPGQNIAATPGKVVFQNELMQLIQYSPTTESVYKTPLLIIPAWINKYYIVDLKPESSFVRWAVEQGLTVFVVSWVNPGEEHREKGFDEYMLEGPLAALDAIEQITGEKQVNAMGYCLGGTLLSITLAHLKAKKRESAIKSATFLTTMVDFAEAGELSVFIDEQQLQMLEERMSENGYLEGSQMAMTFNMLRANDLIWSFVVNNYLLGKEPFPFDVLYWNSDSTRLPAKMHSYYLRNMYQKNLLVKPNSLTVGGTKIDLGTIETPTYFLSTKEDHIAPWRSTYAATQIYKGPKKFVLSGSGHVVGVINPPAKAKYGYWVNGEYPSNPDDWFAKSKETAGSWWPDWAGWIAQHGGEKVPARKPGEGKLKALGDAPGTFVTVRV